MFVLDLLIYCKAFFLITQRYIFANYAIFDIFSPDKNTNSQTWDFINQWSGSARRHIGFYPMSRFRLVETEWMWTFQDRYFKNSFVVSRRYQASLAIKYQSGKLGAPSCVEKINKKIIRHYRILINFSTPYSVVCHEVYLAHFW